MKKISSILKKQARSVYKKGDKVTLQNHPYLISEQPFYIVDGRYRNGVARIKVDMSGKSYLLAFYDSELKPFKP